MAAVERILAAAASGPVRGTDLVVASLLPDRTGRFWVKRLAEEGLLVDATPPSESLPAHWRTTRVLARHLRPVLADLPTGSALASEFRLNRSRYLRDIDVVRARGGDTTHYVHDLNTQLILAELLRSPALQLDAVVRFEPRFTLAIENPDREPRIFTPADGHAIVYQPDLEVRERLPNGRLRRCVIEYERGQDRAAGWSHLERWAGWLEATSQPFEPAVLRFVVDTPGRVRSYVELLEAYADHLIDHPEAAPRNEAVVAVIDRTRLLASADPLDDRNWFWLTLPTGSDTARRLPLHTPGHPGSPYSSYFSRG